MLRKSNISGSFLDNGLQCVVSEKISGRRSDVITGEDTEGEGV